MVPHKALCIQPTAYSVTHITLTTEGLGPRVCSEHLNCFRSTNFKILQQKRLQQTGNKYKNMTTTAQHHMSLAQLSHKARLCPLRDGYSEAMQLKCTPSSPHSAHSWRLSLPMGSPRKQYEQTDCRAAAAEAWRRWLVVCGRGASYHR